MKLNRILFALSLVLLAFLGGCVYENNSSELPETGSIKLTIKVQKNAISNPEYALKDYNEVKVWFFDTKNAKKVKSCLITKKSKDDADYVGQFNFFKQTWVGSNTKVKMETKNSDIKENQPVEAVKDLVIDKIPVGAKYMVVGIPAQGIDAAYIKIEGIVKKGKQTSLYFDGSKLVQKDGGANTDDYPLILKPRVNKQFIARVVPQSFGKNSIGDAYVTGPFNGWNNKDAAYKMVPNADGVYEFVFDGKAPGEFEYKFAYDGNWGDADVCGDKFIDDNNGGNNSKAVINGEATSKFLPVISLVTNKRAKNAPAVSITADNAETWEQQGILKIVANTDKYIVNKLTLIEKIQDQTQLKDNSGRYKIEVWRASNPAIKSVQINYDGILGSDGTLETDTKKMQPDAFDIKNRDISKFIVKREYDSMNEAKIYKFNEEPFYLLENVKMPSVAGTYQFTVTAVDKYNMVSKDKVYLQVVNSVPQILKTVQKVIKVGTTVTDGSLQMNSTEKLLTVMTVKVADVDANDVGSVTADLSQFGMGTITFNDDGKPLVSGDAKAGDSIYTYATLLPLPVGVTKYTIPVTLTDKSGVTAVSNITIDITKELLATTAVPTTDIPTYVKKFGSQGIPTKLVIFDGRKSKDLPANGKIEIMGTLNGWNTDNAGDRWVMKQIAPKVWAILLRLEEGTYSYKFRPAGSWSATWAQDGTGGLAANSPETSLVVTAEDALPTKLMVFDGKNSKDLPANGKLEIMGTLNGWNTDANPTKWVMTQVSDTTWVYLAHLAEGTYSYKFRPAGSWSATWAQDGTGGNAANSPETSLVVTEEDGKIASLMTFDGANSKDLPANGKLEIMGTLNGWNTDANPTKWVMSQITPTSWMYISHLDEGSYSYKFRPAGSWSATWAQDGTGGLAANSPETTLVVKPLTKD